MPVDFTDLEVELAIRGEKFCGFFQYSQCVEIAVDLQVVIAEINPVFWIIFDTAALEARVKEVSRLTELVNLNVEADQIEVIFGRIHEALRLGSFNGVDCANEMGPRCRLVIILVRGEVQIACPKLGPIVFLRRKLFDDQLQYFSGAGNIGSLLQDSQE